MSQETPLIYKALLLLSFLSLSACALFEERTGPPTFYGPREQVYYATFDEVWRSVNVVLQPYPLRVSNVDQGLLETDVVRGQRIFGPPYKSEIASNGESYNLSIRVIKGNLETRPATKVTIVRDTQLQRDFFSDPKTLPSDGMEEKVILYRIAREIQIERALTKAQKSINKIE